MIKLIVCLDEGNAIGWSDGALAYHLPADLKRFKQLTTNSTVVMGRSTYLSLKRPAGLPNRRNIVLSRQPYSAIRAQIATEVEIISSLDWVVRHAEAAVRTVAGTDREPSDVWIIGGKSVYEEALRLDIVDELYLTLVHATCEADVRLDTDLAAWKLFVLHQRAKGIEWAVDVGTTQHDEIAYTTYLTLRKIQ